MKKIIILLIFCISYSFANLLQEAINDAEPYDVLELPKGVYKGNITIDKPLTIEALKGAIIEGQNKGSVIVIKSSYVTLKNLTIKNSGKNRQNYDSAIYARDVSQLLIENCNINSSFFGISFKDVKNSIISKNKIIGDDSSLINKGDAISVYGGQNNIIKENYIEKMRDLLVDGSFYNKIIQNRVKNMRYGIHAMNASGNYFAQNRIEDALAGLYFMYNLNYKVEDNVVLNSKGVKGIGLGLIECSNFEIKNNKFIYNTVGMMIDGSPDKYDSKNMISKNLFSFNSEAIRFKEILINSATPRGKNYFLKNSFDSNITNVIDESSGKELASDGIWEGNFWSNYSGVDENKDGVGDVPYALFYFSDVVWMNNSDAKFFFNSVAMGFLDFLGKIIPTREPYHILTDLKPSIKKDIK